MKQVIPSSSSDVTPADSGTSPHVLVHHESRVNNLMFITRCTAYGAGVAFMGLSVYQAFTGSLQVSFEALAASSAAFLSIGGFGTKPTE
jgi:hypothetical protein